MNLSIKRIALSALFGIGSFMFAISDVVPDSTAQVGGWTSFFSSDNSKPTRPAVESIEAEQPAEAADSSRALYSTSGEKGLKPLGELKKGSYTKTSASSFSIPWGRTRAGRSSSVELGPRTSKTRSRSTSGMGAWGSTLGKSRANRSSSSLKSRRSGASRRVVHKGGCSGG